MLNVYQSNRLEALVTLLAEQCKLPPSSNPFSPETILVHSPGMSQWLKVQLSKKNGICANVNFPLPSSFIWKLYQHLLPEVPDQSPFNKDRMAYKLYELLPNVLVQDEFVAIEQYLACEKATSVNELQSNFDQLRLFNLCEKIADVFDNYLMYRPDWLEHWQNGNNDLPDQPLTGDDIHSQTWQPILWRELVKATGQKQQSNLHRANMHQLLLQKLNDADSKNMLSILPPRLFVFGISTLPSHQLEILQALSEHISVDILWFNPCQQFWGDILSEKVIARLSSKQKQLAEINTEHQQDYFVSGNPLLASWGKVGRDYLDLLSNSNLDITDIFIDIPNQKPSMLEKVQQDVFDLEFRGSQTPLTPQQLNSDFGKQILTSDDDSIFVHNCHSQVRELEVLKDKLLGWFEQDPELKPKDVLVMMPDINQYAPYIDLVFSHQHDSAHSDNQTNSIHIPYTVADRGAIAENPLLDVFCQILALPSSRFSVTDILDFLEVPAVMANFQIDSHELVLIKHWINECHIRWGKSAQHKKQWSLPELDLNTWLYGLKRMMLGYSFNDDQLWNDIVGYQQIEGLDLVTLGKLVKFFSLIEEIDAVLRQPKLVEQWTDFINEVLNKLFHAEKLTDNKDVVAMNQIRAALTQLNLYQDEQDLTKEIPFTLVHNFFKQNLNEQGVVQRFMAGKMNFCTLMPMRSVPFKVICILGMNEGDYPRFVDPISFDLVHLNKPKKGDRSRKHDDRYLFLEAVCSARQKLHLSYIGQSAKTNQELMPSVLLSELLDYLQSSFVCDQKDQGVALHNRIVKTHKLQPFDLFYFESDSDKTLYKSKSTKWFDVVQVNDDVRLDREGAFETIQFDQLFDRKSDQKITKKIKIGSEFDPKIASVDLDDLQLFWSHPIKYYYQNVLQVRLEIRAEQQQDFEVFEHDPLDRYQELSRLLHGKLNKKLNDKLTQTEASSFNSALRSGNYPTANWGQTLLSSYQQQIDEQLQGLFTLLGVSDVSELLNNTVNADLDFEIETDDEDLTQNTINLTANIKLVNGYNVLLRNGKVRAVDQVSNWLKHLFCCASFNAVTSVVIGNDGKCALLTPIQPEQAKEYLAQWLTPYLYSSSEQRLLNWHVMPAVAWLEAKLKGDSELQLNKVLANNVNPMPFAINLANDFYASKTLMQVEDFEQSFFKLTEHLIAPMLNHQEMDKTAKISKLLLSHAEGEA